MLTHGWSLKIWCSERQARHRKMNIMWFHWREAPGTVKFMETESRVVVTRGRECLMGQTFSVGSWGGPGGTGGGGCTSQCAHCLWAAPLEMAVTLSFILRIFYLMYLLLQQKSNMSGELVLGVKNTVSTKMSSPALQAFLWGDCNSSVVKNKKRKT